MRQRKVSAGAGDGLEVCTLSRARTRGQCGRSWRRARLQDLQEVLPGADTTAAARGDGERVLPAGRRRAAPPGRPDTPCGAALSVVARLAGGVLRCSQRAGHHTLTGGGRSAVPDESALTPPPPPVGRATTSTGTPGRRLGERHVATEVPAQRP